MNMVMFNRNVVAFRIGKQLYSAYFQWPNHRNSGPTECCVHHRTECCVHVYRWRTVQGTDVSIHTFCFLLILMPFPWLLNRSVSSTERHPRFCPWALSSELLSHMDFHDDDKFSTAFSTTSNALFLCAYHHPLPLSVLININPTLLPKPWEANCKLFLLDMYDWSLVRWY